MLSIWGTISYNRWIPMGLVSSALWLSGCITHNSCLRLVSAFLVVGPHSWHSCLLKISIMALASHSQFYSSPCQELLATTLIFNTHTHRSPHWTMSLRSLQWALTAQHPRVLTGEGTTAWCGYSFWVAENGLPSISVTTMLGNSPLKYY